MNRYLLDTSVLLYMLGQTERLSKKSAAIIRDSDTLLALSIASLWEITIKLELGKLHIQGSLENFFRIVVSDLNINILPVQTPHLLVLHKLPDVHRYPFDRLIVSQAIAEKMIVISSDRIFKKYRVKVLW